MVEPELPREADGPITTRTLRQFAGLWLVVFAGLGWWQWFGDRHKALALVLVGLACLLGPLGLVRPEATRAAFVGMRALTYPIGWLVSRLLLAVLFYGVFTPVGILFQLTGRDVLRLRRQIEKDSYWDCKPAPPDLRGYLRQS